MKKSIVIGLVIVVLFSSFNQQIVQGHDPSMVSPVYHFTDQILEVWIHHPVSYPDIHWVNNVQVRKNNVLVGNYSYDHQPNFVEMTYNYSISAVHFDIIKVRVFCTYQGDTEVELLVLDPDNPTTRLPTTTSKLIGISLRGFMILLSSVLVVFSKKKK
ncbi:MAG: hypothetical protein ACTSSK_02705 [Candidatus Heimdallarchaeota archaeon]